jgi:hypothetical protein
MTGSKTLLLATAIALALQGCTQAQPEPPYTGDVNKGMARFDVAPDAETAIRFARAFLPSHFEFASDRPAADGYPLSASNAPLKAQLRDGYWYITRNDPPLPPPRTNPDGTTSVWVSAGGGFVLVLAKHDARVVNWEVYR